MTSIILGLGNMRLWIGCDVRTFPFRQTGFRLWSLATVALAGLTLAFVWFSYRFGYDTDVIDMPIIGLVIGLMAAGGAYLGLLFWGASATPVLFVFPPSPSVALPHPRAKTLLVIMIATGFALRLALLASEPVLEDDYQRYLWDGAVTAHGLNPYARSPAAAMVQDPETSKIARLAVESGRVAERINHPELCTVYPPVAQATFALAHVVQPWSLTVWRLICFMGEAATLWLVLALLRETARPPLWAAVYWLNPLVLKETINSAHLEAILMPCVLAAVLFAVRRKLLGGTFFLALATGIKLWPALFLPVILRSALDRPGTMAAALGLFGGLCAAMALPIILAGVTPCSGLIAYATHWQTNSALFPALKSALGIILGALGWADGVDMGRVARAGLAIAMCGLALLINRTAPRDAADILRRCLILTGALLLLSPAQFPWYYLWVLPFLAIRPVAGLMVLTLTLPLYYLSFYYLAREQYPVFRDVWVWAIWAPVWGLLAYDGVRGTFFRSTASVGDANSR